MQRLYSEDGWSVELVKPGDKEITKPNNSNLFRSLRARLLLKQVRRPPSQSGDRPIPAHIGEMGQNVLIIVLAAVIALAAVYSLFTLRRKWAVNTCVGL